MAFTSHSKLLATLMGPIEVRGHGVAMLLYNSKGSFVSIPKANAKKNRNILLIKCVKLNFRKIVGMLVDEL